MAFDFYYIPRKLEKQKNKKFLPFNNNIPYSVYSQACTPIYIVILVDNWTWYTFFLVFPIESLLRMCISYSNKLFTHPKFDDLFSSLFVFLPIKFAYYDDSFDTSFFAMWVFSTLKFFSMIISTSIILWFSRI